MTGLEFEKNMFVKQDFVVNNIITLQTLPTSSRRGTPFPKTQHHPLNHISKVFNFLILNNMIHNFICTKYRVLASPVTDRRPLCTISTFTDLVTPSTDQYRPLLTQYYMYEPVPPSTTPVHSIFFGHVLSNHFFTHG